MIIIYRQSKKELQKILQDRLKRRDTYKQLSQIVTCKVWRPLCCLLYNRQLRCLLSTPKEVESLSNELVAYWEVCVYAYSSSSCILWPLLHTLHFLCLAHILLCYVHVHVSKEGWASRKGWLHSSTPSTQTCSETLPVASTTPSRDAPPISKDHHNLTSSLVLVFVSCSLVSFNSHHSLYCNNVCIYIHICFTICQLTHSFFLHYFFI